MKEVLRRIWAKFLADPKTTVVGFITIIAWLIGKFGLDFSAQDQLIIINFCVFFGFLVARDTKQIPPPGQ